VKLFITGAAGFVGSNVVDVALEKGHQVVGFDNLSTGREVFLSSALRHPGFTLIRGDITSLEQLVGAMAPGTDAVIHLAANADVRRGTEQPLKDLQVNTVGTWNVLEATRRAGVRQLVFSSTGSVYGEPEVFPTPEDAPFPVQTSLYAASKAAGEGLISAWCHGFGLKATVFRMVSVLGPRYTHGHVFDFVRALKKDPSRLKVLGDGQQVKSYLHVGDLVRAFFLALDQPAAGYRVLNVGHDDTLRVVDSIALITARLNVTPTLEFTGGARGWVGDSPHIHLDTRRLKALGWASSRTLPDAVRETVDYLVEHPDLIVGPDPFVPAT